MKTRRTAGVGSVSLVLIFSTLCLAVFAVLSLSDAVSRQRTAELLAQSATDYYAADTEATRVYAAVAAALRAGTQPGESVCGVAVGQSEDGNGTHYTYACDIDDDSLLQVELIRADGRLTIARWAVCARDQWVGDDDIPVLQ